MKKSIATVCILLGSVIGAGFVTGAEIVRFFGAASLPVLLFCAAFFFVGFYLLLRAGAKYGSFEGFLSRAFGVFSPIVRGAFVFSAYAVLVAMLAGIDSLCPSYAPFISALVAFAAYFLVRKGRGALGAFNLLLVPCILVYIAVNLAKGGEISLLLLPERPVRAFLFAALYGSMNVFLSAPVIVDCGAGLGKKGIVFSAFLPAAILVFFVGWIACAVAAKSGAAEAEMPLLYLLKDGKLFPLIVFFGIVTTLVSAIYPIQKAAGKSRAGTAIGLFFTALACALARFGFSKIVAYVYPALGGLGALFLGFVALYGQFFEQGDQKIHHARQHAQNDGRRHNEV